MFFLHTICKVNYPHVYKLICLFILFFISALVFINTNAEDNKQTSTPVFINTCNLNRDPAWSFNGSKIAFVSERAHNPDIWIMASDGSNLHNLTSTSKEPDTNPLWSPIDDSLAFLSGRSGNMNLWVMKSDGSEARNLTENTLGSDLGFSWSPDGRYIAVPSQQNQFVDIWIINSSDFTKKNITPNNKKAYKWPTWSPNSKQLAFTSFSNTAVFQIDIDGAHQIILDNTGINIKAVWSPTDQFILLSREDKPSEDINIWRMNSDGSNLVNLTKENYGADLEPSWSPDGTMIAFASNRNLHSDIWRMNSDGSNLLNLTSEIDGEAAKPKWSPDGKRIIFEVYHEYTSHIWIMDSDGKNPTNLTDSQTNCE